MNTQADYPILLLSLYDHVDGETCYHVTTGTTDQVSVMGRDFQAVMPAEIIERLHLHGRCTGCDGPVDAALNACKCGHVPRERGVLEVTIRNKAALPTFHALLGKVLERAKSAKRRARLAAVENTLTKAEVDLLLEWQRGLCFYCGQQFLSKDGRRIYRRDHVKPLLYGGPTTIENTVLACVSCNTKKGAGDAAFFSAKTARLRVPEVKPDYTAMRQHFRRRLNAYLKARAAAQGQSCV